VKNLVLDEPPPSGDCPDTPGILLEEVQNALRKMKKQNAPGIDNITAEELQLAMEDEGFESLMEAHMSSMGNQPNKYLLTGKIIIIPIHKKNKPDGSNYRGIILLCHISKVSTTIILQMIRKRTDEILSEEQTGYTTNRSTVDQIFRCGS